MKKHIHEFKLFIAGALVGALVGFIYWKWIGCHNNDCSITATPASSMIYFSVIGGLFLGMFSKEPTHLNH